MKVYIVRCRYPSDEDSWVCLRFERAMDLLLEKVPQGLTAEVKGVLANPMEDILDYEFDDPDVGDEAVWSIVEKEVIA